MQIEILNFNPSLTRTYLEIFIVCMNDNKINEKYDPEKNHKT